MFRTLVKSRNKKLFFLFLNQNKCYGYSKEPSQWDGSFKYPKHMLKLMGKKKSQFYAKELLNLPYDYHHHSSFLIPW